MVAMESLLPAEPASASRARRFVVDTLQRLQYDTVTDVAELLVSELVTNALLHAGSEVRVRVEADGSRIRVEVQDASPVTVRKRTFSPESTTGRGLALVEALATRWGSDVVTDRGKAVWFELEEAGAV